METEEIWVFGGTRLDRNGKRFHSWYPTTVDEFGGRNIKVGAGDDPLWYARKGSFAVAGEYAVRVSRVEDKTTRHGSPEFIGRHGDDAACALLWAKHRAAETAYERGALENNARRRDALDEALQPVLDIIRQTSPVQRDGLVAYMIRRVYAQ